MKSMADRIYSYLTSTKNISNSLDLVQKFLKINNVTDSMADRLIAPILQKDGRFTKDSESHWHAVKTVRLEQLILDEIPFVVFFITPNPQQHPIPVQEAESLEKWLKTHAVFNIYRGGSTEGYSDLKDLLQKASKYVFVPYERQSLSLLKKLARRYFALEPELLTLSIRSLVHALYPKMKFSTWDDLASSLSVIHVQSSTLESRVKTAVAVLEHLIDTARKNHLNTLESLLAYLNRDKKTVDFSRYEFDKDFLRRIPELPGVYSFYNRKGDPIYVGKSLNLHYRINSYFWNTGESLEKISGILDSLSSISYTILGSELEALLEEYRLIEKLKPPYNTRITIPERTLETSPRIILLPSKYEHHMKLYLLADPLELMEYEYNCDSSDQPGLEDLISNLHRGGEYLNDPCKTLVIFYQARYSDYLNIIDADAYPDTNAILQILKRYCPDSKTLLQTKQSFIE